MKLTKPNTGSPPASGSWCLLPYYIVKHSINKEQALFFLRFLLFVLFGISSQSCYHKKRRYAWIKVRLYKEEKHE